MNEQVKKVNKESKSMLARLMASENITVTHQAGNSTASFNPDTRVLLLPILKDMTGLIYNGFIAHEIGHALYTPKAEVLIELTKHKSILFSYINITEDVRIEKLVKRKFPGVVKTFNSYYKNLWDRGFFGCTSKDVNSLTLVDRINIYAKVGPFSTVEFSSEEQALLDMAKNAETFEEAVTAAYAIYDFQQKQNEQKQNEQKENEQQENKKSEDGESEVEEDNDEESNDAKTEESSDDDSEESESGESEENDSDDDEDDEEGDAKSEGNESCDEESNDEEEGEESNDAESDSLIGGDDEEGEADSEESDESEKGDSTDEDSTEEGEDNLDEDDCSENGESKNEGMIEPVTQDAMDSSFEENELSTTNSAFITMTVDSFNNDWKGAVASHKDIYNTHREFEINVGDHINKTTTPHIVSDFDMLMKKNKPSVNYLVKLFEERKSASEYKRIQTSKSGIIDVNKLHNYKLDENIFKTNTTVKEGKNHGFVFFVDFSGSMLGVNLEKTIEQLLIQVEFAKKINMPFRVYSYTSGSVVEMPKNTSEYLKGDIDSIKDGEYLFTLPKNDDITILEILTSKMNTSEYKYACKVLRLVSINRYSSHSKYFRFGGTPLDHTIMMSSKIVNDFKQEEAVEICNVMFLNDGGNNKFDCVGRRDGVNGKDARLYNTTTYYNIPLTKQTNLRKKRIFKIVDILDQSFEIYDFDNSENKTFRGMLLDVFKRRTGANIIGLTLMENTKRSKFMLIPKYKLNQLFAKNDFTKNGYVVLEDLAVTGYDQMYFINVTEKENKLNLVNLSSSDTMGKFKKAFASGNLSKQKDRLFANNLMTLIA